MKTRPRQLLTAILLSVGAVGVSACASSGGSYGYSYDSHYRGSQYRDFCSGPYRLQPEYCRTREYNGTMYLNLHDREPPRHRGHYRHDRHRYRR